MNIRIVSLVALAALSSMTTQLKPQEKVPVYKQEALLNASFRKGFAVSILPNILSLGITIANRGKLGEAVGSQFLAHVFGLGFLFPVWFTTDSNLMRNWNEELRDAALKGYGMGVCCGITAIALACICAHKLQ